jgi:hypothetical protein
MPSGSKGIAIAVCGGVAALIVAALVARQQVGEDSPAGAGGRAAEEMMHGGAEDESGAGRGGAAPRMPGTGTRVGDGRAGQPRSAPIADVQRRLAARDRAARDLADGGAPASLDAPIAGRAARPADEALGGAVPQQVRAASQPSDVAYDGADEVFETQTWTTGPSIGAITTTAGTLSFWVKPEWESGDPDHAHLVQLGEHGPRVVKDGKYLRLEYTNVMGGNELGGIADTTNWQTGEWRHVTATWEEGTLTLYVDGEALFANVPDVPPPWEDAPRLYVGTRPPVDGRIIPPAQLAQVTVMSRGLSVDEVERLFGAARPPGS